MRHPISVGIGSYFFTFPVVITLLVQWLAVVAWECTILAIPIEPGNELVKLSYWTLLITVILANLSLLVLYLSASTGRVALSVFSLIVYIVSFLWQAYVLGYMIWALIPCNGWAICADNVDRAGNVIGPYGGATVRFIALFVIAIILVFIEAFGIWVSILQVRGTRRYSVRMRNVMIQTRTRVAVGVGAYFLTIPVILTIIVQWLSVVVWSCALLAIPFEAGNALMGLPYWTFFITLILTNVILLLLCLGVSTGRNGIPTLVFFLYILVFTWQIFVFIYMLLTLLTCNGDAICADNFDRAGTVAGTYGGPTARFMTIFVVSIVIMVILAFGCWVAYTLWSVVRAFYLPNAYLMGSSAAARSLESRTRAIMEMQTMLEQTEAAAITRTPYPESMYGQPQVIVPSGGYEVQPMSTQSYLQAQVGTAPYQAVLPSVQLYGQQQPLYVPQQQIPLAQSDPQRRLQQQQVQRTASPTRRPRSLSPTSKMQALRATTKSQPQLPKGQPQRTAKSPTRKNATYRSRDVGDPSYVGMQILEFNKDE